MNINLLTFLSAFLLADNIYVMAQVASQSANVPAPAPSVVPSPAAPVVVQPKASQAVVISATTLPPRVTEAVPAASKTVSKARETSIASEFPGAGDGASPSEGSSNISFIIPLASVLGIVFLMAIVGYSLRIRNRRRRNLMNGRRLDDIFAFGGMRAAPTMAPRIQQTGRSTTGVTYPPRAAPPQYQQFSRSIRNDDSAIAQEWASAMRTPAPVDTEFVQDTLLYQPPLGMDDEEMHRTYR